MLVLVGLSLLHLVLSLPCKEGLLLLQISNLLTETCALSGVITALKQAFQR